MLRYVAQVPFADRGSGIALSPERLGDRGLRRRQSAGRIRKQYAAPPRHAVSDRQPARHQGRPARRTQRRGRIKLCEPEPFPGEPIQVGRLDGGMPVTAQVAVAQVIGEQNDEVGRPLIGRVQRIRRDRHIRRIHRVRASGDHRQARKNTNDQGKSNRHYSLPACPAIIRWKNSISPILEYALRSKSRRSSNDRVWPCCSGAHCNSPGAKTTPKYGA